MKNIVTTQATISTKKPSVKFKLCINIFAVSFASICGQALAADTSNYESTTTLSTSSTYKLPTTTSNKGVNTLGATTDVLVNSAIDLTNNKVSGIPTPVVQISDADYIETILIPTTSFSSEKTLDVSLLDDFIKEISPHARHYPPNFKTVTQQYFTKQRIKEYEEWLRPYAEDPNASFEVLIRGAKINGMARNLNLGSDYAVRASNYIAQALKQQPNSAEANFLYGMMLSEGGGFKESKKYLNKAVEQGYTEAEQSLAQADILTDNRPEALNRLLRLQSQYPNDAIIKQQVKIVQNGDYYIWDLPVK